MYEHLKLNDIIERACSKGASLLNWFYLERYWNNLFKMWAEIIFNNFFSFQVLKIISVHEIYSGSLFKIISRPFFILHSFQEFEI